MHPILFHIGPLTLHSYGLMMTIAFIVAIWLASRRARKAGLPQHFAIDISFVLIIVSLVCARLTYVVGHWSEFRQYPLDIISPIQHDGTIGIAGLVLLGGVIGGIIATLIYVRIKKLPLFLVLDVLTPPVVIGMAIGRIGCFLNGCCFGFPTGLPWGCVFPSDSYAGTIYPNIPIHPTQLYDMLLMVTLFIVLLLLEKRPHPRGQTFAFFLVGYAIARFWVEGLRWYEPDLIPTFIGSLELTGSRIVSIVMFIAGILLLIHLHRKRAVEKDKTP
jgi:phosphatidylglycerol:prolipoprotein diacylglycerol transferase